MGETVGRAIKEYEEAVREAQRLEEVYSTRLRSKKGPPVKDSIDQIMEEFSGFGKGAPIGDKDQTGDAINDQTKANPEGEAGELS
jgi:hypothetical protein